MNQMASDTRRPTICLAMIVKDESSSIEGCLSSALPYIDSWVIVDTGSVDDTCERIERTLDSIPGHLERRPFVDFGYNRTELMELVYEQRMDWVLLLDADMMIEVDGDLHDLLSQNWDREIVLVEIEGETERPMPHLVRGNRHWKFEGVAQDVLLTPGRPRPARMQAVRIRHLANDGSLFARLERDRRLLEAEFARHPLDPRNLFYLAQACRDLGEIDAAVQYYAMRSVMNSPETWDEETFYAQYQLGVLQMDDDWPAAADALLLAWSMRPTRAEPLYRLAFGWRTRGAWPAAYLFASRGVHIPVPDDVLFVDIPMYRWGLRFERSVAAWYVGERDLSRVYTEELLSDPDLPDYWRVHAEENLRTRM